MATTIRAGIVAQRPQRHVATSASRLQDGTWISRRTVSRLRPPARWRRAPSAFRVVAVTASPRTACRRCRRAPRRMPRQPECVVADDAVEGQQPRIPAAGFKSPDAVPLQLRGAVGDPLLQCPGQVVRRGLGGALLGDVGVDADPSAYGAGCVEGRDRARTAHSPPDAVAAADAMLRRRTCAGRRRRRSRRRSSPVIVGMHGAHRAVALDPPASGRARPTRRCSPSLRRRPRWSTARPAPLRSRRETWPPSCSAGVTRPGPEEAAAGGCCGRSWRPTAQRIFASGRYPADCQCGEAGIAPSRTRCHGRGAATP